MKALKLALFCLCVSIFSLACTKNPTSTDADDNDNRTPEERIFDTFSDRFDSRATARWTSSGIDYSVAFGDGGTLELSDVVVRERTSTNWPAIDAAGGVWTVDGVSTGITTDADPEKVVVVVYETDTDAIYVTLSSGRILFFHSDKVVDIARFVFQQRLNPTLSRDVVCTIDGTTISGRLDPRTVNFDLTPTVIARGEMPAGAIDCRTNQTITLDGKDFTLAMVHTGAIPILYIDTEATDFNDSNIEKDTYRTATMRIEDPAMLFASTPSQTVSLEIKGRGNTTWDLPKKPYKLKLAQDQPLLGMPSNRHFVLLANYGDRSFLRNCLAFRLSGLAGMQWPIRWVPVEIHIDGSYRGQYMATEHVRMGANRINMPAGGYLYNIDHKPDAEEKYFIQHDKTPYGNDAMWFTFNDPELPTDAQMQESKEYINKVEAAINKASTMTTGYVAQLRKVMDVESFIAFFFVQETAKNIDGNMRLSTYVGWPTGGVLYMPCVWDFDNAFGIANWHSGEQQGANSTPQGWYVRNARWFTEMFKNQEFCDLVSARWTEFYSGLAGIDAEVNVWKELVRDAQGRDCGVWGYRDYSTEVNNMMNFMHDRADWMNTEITAGRHKK